MDYKAKLLVLLLFTFCLIFKISAEAQETGKKAGFTAGTFTFTVKTITNNSTYSPKNVFAIWIKNAQGNFVVSRKVMANARKQHLVKWNANSAGNTVSAITGATLTTHQTHTIEWDGKDASGNDMPDGIYQVWVEYSSTNSAFNNNPGPFLTVEFDKGPAIQHIAPANATYYNDIVADWIPLGVGTHDLAKSGASLFIAPNPFSTETTIQLIFEKPSQAYICIYDITGKKVKSLVNDSFIKGTYTFSWNGKTEKGEELKNGIYLFQIRINGYTEIQKIIKCR